MKQTLSYLACIATSVSYAQTTEPIFSEQLIQFNPAAAGLFQQKAAFLNSQAYLYPKGNFFGYGSTGYHQRSEKLHGGFGITMGATGSRYRSGGMPTYLNSGGTYSTKLNYSYQFSLSNGGVLSVGSGLGFAQGDYKYGYSTAVNTIKGQSLDLDFGIMYKQKSWYVGLGSPSISLYNKVTTSDTNYQPKFEPFVFSKYIPTIQAGYTFRLGENWTLQPQVVFNQRGELSLAATYKQRYFAKTSLNERGIGLMVGAQVNDRLRIGYGVSNLSSLGKGFRPVHQVNFAFTLR